MRPSIRRWLFLAVLILGLLACTVPPASPTAEAPTSTSAPAAAVRELPSPSPTDRPSTAAPPPTPSASATPASSTPASLSERAEEFSELSAAQRAAGFALWVPSSVPDSLPLEKVWVWTWANGDRRVRILYAAPGDALDANRKSLDVRLDRTAEAVSAATLQRDPKGVVPMDLQEVQVRGHSGYAYWLRSVAAGNSAELAWREGALNITVSLYGDWPAPSEKSLHGLDAMLLSVAESLQPYEAPPATFAVDGWTGTIVKLDSMAQYDDYFLRTDGERYGIDGSLAGLSAQIESARQQGTAVQVWGWLETGVPNVNGRRIVVKRLVVLIAGATATPVPTPTPAAPPITPVVTGAEIAVSSWSPDGEWLAFWKANDAAPAQLHRAMTLWFYNPRTGQTCDCPEIRSKTTDISPPPLTWEDGGQAVVQDGATTWRGAPCQGSFRATSDVPPPADALSPGGSYRAATREEQSGDAQIEVTTTLSDTPSGQTVQAVEYLLPAEVQGNLGLGGACVTDSLFLIRETLDRGPLLVDVRTGRVIAVMAELFGLDQLPSPNLGFWAAAQAVAGSDSYHIVLGALHHGLFGGVGIESTWPPLRLYHSETGQVEELPFKVAWSPTFSPDGRWLLMDARPWRTRAGTDETYPSSALWARPVDPPGSAVHLVADGDSHACWSPDWTRMAMAGPGSSLGLPNVTSVYSFPEGTVLNAWATGDYRAQQAAWSPDSKRLAMSGLAMSGNVPAGLQYALFVVEP